MIKLMIVILSYLFAGLLLAAIARDNNKSRLFSLGLLVAWPVYVWMYFCFYVCYYGLQFVRLVFK